MKRNPFAKRRIILIILLCLMPISILAQKVNPDTLNLDQLNLYKHKAVTMRNAGIVLTSCGLVVIPISYVLGVSLERDVFVVFIGAGIASTIVGIPLWAAGASRMHVGELLTLGFDQLNLYKDKAITLRNAGGIVILSGLGLMVAGIIANYTQDPYIYSYLPAVLELVGVPVALIGTPIWAVGSGRKANAELTLKKFKLTPENSMAIGLGITIMF